MECKCIFFFGIFLLISVSMAQGSKKCPSIKRPRLGSKSCVGFKDNKECKSRCLPGYKFKDHDDKKEVIHKCKDGKWAPSDKFPECIPDGSCMFDFEEQGNMKCRTNMRRKTCEITCGTKEKGKFSCVNGKWDPPLPSCVKTTGGSKKCPSIKRPRHGSKSCVGFKDNKECKSRCLPGYKFKDHDDKKEVIHKCKDGKWAPSDKFPECIPDGSCMFDFEEAGNMKCRTNKRRKTCEITCGTKEKGKFSCVNGKWDPPLPSCVKSTGGEKR